jgi:hypothetical protein
VVGKTNRRLIGSAVIGATTVTIAQFLPGVAAAATHQSSFTSSTPRTEPGAEPGVAPNRDATNTVAPTTGCSPSSSPDYGCGKLTLQAVPVVGTFPTGSLPSLGGLTFDITGTSAENDKLVNNSMGSCTTTSDGSDDGATCPESNYSNGDADGDRETDGSWVAGDPYDAMLDSSTPPPANTMIPGISGTFPNCTAFGSNNGCPNLTPVPVYGKYHQVGLRVVNSITGRPVAKATYQLCSPTTTAPALGTHACPTGTTVLDTETTGASGALTFKSLYVGSNNYSILPTKEPSGYQAAKSQALAVPVVANTAEAGALVQTTVDLAPTHPSVKTHHVTVRENKAITFNAFAGAKPIVGPLTLITLSKPRHGSAHRSGGKITYKPRKGFVGKDVFTYTVRNAVGATATGRVVVHVKAKPKSH